jgi:curved DNA-binding protein CbpA
MSTERPDPYAVLGVRPGAGDAEIATAYRRAVRACHPDTAHPDPDRLIAVIAAYRQLRDREAHPSAGHHRRRSSRGSDIPVRVHHDSGPPPEPDLRAGPVRRHDA